MEIDKRTIYGHYLYDAFIYGIFTYITCVTIVWYFIHHLYQEISSSASNGDIMGCFELLGNTHILVYYTIVSYKKIEVYGCKEKEYG